MSRSFRIIVEDLVWKNYTLKEYTLRKEVTHTHLESWIRYFVCINPAPVPVRIQFREIKFVDAVVIGEVLVDYAYDLEGTLMEWCVALFNHIDSTLTTMEKHINECS